MRPLTGIFSQVKEPSSSWSERQTGVGTSHILQIANFYYTVAAMTLPLHLLAHGKDYHWHDGLISWFLLLVVFYEAKETFGGPARPVPLGLLAALQFYLTYGLAVFLPKETQLVWGIYSPSDETATAALFLALGGTLICLSSLKLGVYLRTRKAWDIWGWLPGAEVVGRNRLIIYAMVSLYLWYAANLNPWLLPVGARQILLSVVSPYLALSLLLYAWFSGPQRIGKVFVLGYILIMAFFGVLSGSMENFLIPFVALVVAAWLWRGDVLTKTVIVSVLLLLFLSPAKYAYRNFWWESQSEPEKVDVGSRMGYWKESLSQNYAQEKSRVRSLDVVGSRFNGLVPLAQVIDWVPSVVPPRQVSWLKEVATYLVPRILWPSKPKNTERLYHDYAVTFGYQTTETLRGSTTGTTMLVEGFWATRWVGALSYAAILGFLLGIFFSGGWSKEGADTTAIISMAFLISNFQVLMPVGIALSSLPSFIVGTWLAFSLLTVGQKAHRKISS